MELERTDALIARLWPLIDRPKPDMDALAAYLRIANYRAKIAGLYAPRRQQVEVEVRGRIEHHKLEALRILAADIDIAEVVDEHITHTLEQGDTSDED